MKLEFSRVRQVRIERWGYDGWGTYGDSGIVFMRTLPLKRGGGYDYPDNSTPIMVAMTPLGQRLTPDV